MFRPIVDMSSNDIIRLWAGIELAGSDDCWLWTKGCNNGYGYLWLNGQPIIVTRALWFHWYGYDPGSLMVLHTCHNPPCCNPNHLYLGTQVENMQDMFAAKRATRRGEFGSKAFFMDELVKEIRQRVADGERQIDIANQFGVTRSCISNMVAGRTWSHF